MTGEIIIGFSGKIGSGKTALSSRVAELLGLPRVSFGDFVREVAQQRRLEITRENLQDLGQKLVDQDCAEFCRAVLAQSGCSLGQSLVIDGIRHLHIAETIKSLVHPSCFRLIVISLLPAERIARLRARDSLNSDDHSRADSHPTEADVDDLLPRHADLLVDGSKDLDALSEEVINYVRQQ